VDQFPHLLKWIDRIAQVSETNASMEVSLTDIAICCQERNWTEMAGSVDRIARL
jgi:hypothetical protein